VPSTGSGAVRLAVVTSVTSKADTTSTICETYATLLNRRIIVPSQKTDYVALEKNHLAALLAPHVRRISFDEAWYLARYPDVEAAIRRGDVASAADHYCQSGYFEDRLPYRIEVDEAWYVAEYTDVREAIEGGAYASGAAHFYDVGYREGRLPRANFTLRLAD
jgi:hypothetical protein